MGDFTLLAAATSRRSFDYHLRKAYELLSERDRLRRRRGNYSSNKKLWRKANEMVKKTPHLYLDVPTYNLKEKAWEEHTPCLIAPKPRPVVFAYEGKIFALRGSISRGFDIFQIPDGSPAFEVLDTNPPIHPRKSWTELPAPPFDMKQYTNHILDKANGIFFLFFHSYFFEKKPVLWRLHLNETPYRWESAPLSKSWSYTHPIGSSAGDRMRHISDGQSHGCIVDYILFSYEKDESGRPFILGKYVGWDESRCGPWEIDGLDKVIVGKADTSESLSFLNHIGNYRFCLIVQGYLGCESSTNPLYSLIFDLVKEDLPDEFWMIKTQCV